MSEAMSAGFSGVRFGVEMTWTLGPDIGAEQLEHWEASINTLFSPGFPGRIICQYNRGRLSPEAMLAALHTHPLAILGDEVCPNLFYRAPLILGGSEARPSDRLDWMVAQLKRARVVERERESLAHEAHAERRLSIHAAVSRILAGSSSLPDAAGKLLSTVGQSAGWEVGCLWLVDHVSQSLRVAEVWTAPGLSNSEFERVTREQTFAPGVGLPGRVWQHGAPFWIPDLAHDPNFPRRFVAERDGLQSGFAFPIRAGLEVIGVIEFFSRRARSRSEAILDIALATGTQIGQFAERKEAERRQQEAEEARRIESANKASRQFRLLADQSPVLIWVADTSRSVTWTNRNWLEFVGREMDRELGDGWMENVHPDDLDHLVRTYQESFAACRPFEIEFRLKRHDGNYRWILNHGVPIHDDDDGFSGYAGTCIDLTERKEAEEAIRRLASIVESSEDAIFGKDLDGIITSWNEGAERLYGYAPEEVIGQPMTMLIPVDRHHEGPDILRRIRAGERINHFETIRRRKDGRLIDVSLTVSPIRDRHGAVCGVSKIARDITQQKAIDAAMRASEARLSAVFQQAGAGIAQTALDGRFLLVNDVYCEIIGRSREALQRLCMHDLIHPEDLSHSLALFEHVVLDGAPFTIERRYVRPDGSLVWVRESVVAIRNAGGGVESALGVAQDITERKRVERALRAREEQLRLVTDHAPVSLAHCDRSHRYKFVNRTYADRFGMEPDALIGRLVSDVVGTEAYESFRHHMDAALAGRRVEFEIEIPYSQLGRAGCTASMSRSAPRTAR